MDAFTYETPHACYLAASHYSLERRQSPKAVAAEGRHLMIEGGLERGLENWGVGDTQMRDYANNVTKATFKKGLCTSGGAQLEGMM